MQCRTALERAPAPLFVIDPASHLPQTPIRHPPHPIQTRRSQTPKPQTSIFLISTNSRSQRFFILIILRHSYVWSPQKMRKKVGHAGLTPTANANLPPHLIYVVSKLYHWHLRTLQQVAIFGDFHSQIRIVNSQQK